MNAAESYIKIRQDIVRLLVDERKAQKLTQETLAKRLTIQRSNLARFERGEQNPSLDFLTSQVSPPPLSEAKAVGWDLLVSVGVQAPTEIAA